MPNISMLDLSNVRISTRETRLVITTDNASYDEVKKLLSVLQEGAGIPFDLSSEMSADYVLTQRREGKVGSYALVANAVIPRTVENSFTIWAYKIFTDPENSSQKLSELAEELKLKFESFGLSVNIF